MSTVRALSIFAVVVFVLFAPGAAAAKEKQPTSGVHHTAAGTAAARRSLLRLADLGTGWSAGATPKKIGKLTCGSAPPTLAGVVETGSAITQTYRESSSGPFLSQATFIYGGAAEAARFWQHVSGPAALSCLAKGVAGGSTKDVADKSRRCQSPNTRRTAANASSGTTSPTTAMIALFGTKYF